MKVLGCRCPRNGCSEGFQNSNRYYEVESIFSKIEDLTFTAFLKMTFTADIYLKSCKTFSTTVSREVFLL